jgi:hypothetical protein
LSLIHNLEEVLGKNMKIKLIVMIIVGLSASAGAQAALFDRGNGLIYDDYSNITWSANANIAGFMDWPTAVSWADNLSLGGYSDWRLPTTIPAIVGYNQSGSEMGHLFYTDLGVTEGNPITSSTSSNYKLFSNVKASAYWGSAYAPNPTYAWLFNTYVGMQYYTYETNFPLYAWAVRSGDVAAVPLPGAVWLFGSGLMVLLALKRGVI